MPFFHACFSDFSIFFQEYDYCLLKRTYGPIHHKNNMAKSLGDYNIEQSSSSDFKNIKWTKKNPLDEKPKNPKKTKKISPTNTIVKQNKTANPPVKKIYKIKNDSVDDNLNNNTSILDKKSQIASASNCKIMPSFKRPAR